MEELDATLLGPKPCFTPRLCIVLSSAVEISTRVKCTHIANLSTLLFPVRRFHILIQYFNILILAGALFSFSMSRQPLRTSSPESEFVQMDTFDNISSYGFMHVSKSGFGGAKPKSFPASHHAGECWFVISSGNRT